MNLIKIPTLLEINEELSSKDNIIKYLDDYVIKAVESYGDTEIVISKSDDPDWYNYSGNFSGTVFLNRIPNWIVELIYKDCSLYVSRNFTIHRDGLNLIITSNISNPTFINTYNKMVEVIISMIKDTLKSGRSIVKFAQNEINPVIFNRIYRDFAEKYEVIRHNRHIEIVLSFTK